MRRANNHARFAVLVASAVLVGAGAAVAATQPSHRHPRAGSALQRRDRAEKALVARKLRDRRAHAAAQVTYPAQGINITPAGANAQSEAQASGVTSAPAAVTALKQYPGAVGAFGPGAGSMQFTATLQTVTESLPITKGVAAGTPYQAWVVQANGPAIYVGGIGTTTPVVPVPCHDVAIYDVELAAWTEFIQSC